jgi:hypothetical protein
MKILSIKETIQNNQEKLYLTDYASYGYEMGFGEEGHYQGHSHKYFYDIIFSPNNNILIKNEPSRNNCYLSIIPPRTFMNDIKVGKFFFLKFCPTNDIFNVPEKTNRILNDSKVKLVCKKANFCFPWYPKPYLKHDIWIHAQPHSLEINFSNKHKLRIIG